MVLAVSFGFLDQFLLEWGVFSPHIQQAILKHQLGVLWFNSILTLFPQREHQIPSVTIQSHKTALFPTHSDASCKPRLLTCVSDLPTIDWRFQWPHSTQDASLFIVLLTDGQKLEVPMIPSSGLINLLEQINICKKHFTFQITDLL